MSAYEGENKMVIDELWCDEKEESAPTVDCALCGAEVDEETTTYGICEKCWTDHHNFDNALAYGAEAHVKNCAEINGFYAYILTPEQIETALKQVVLDMKKYYYDFSIKTADEFLRDDDGDFADWLKEQKGNE